MGLGDRAEVVLGVVTTGEVLISLAFDRGECFVAVEGESESLEKSDRTTFLRPPIDLRFELVEVGAEEVEAGEGSVAE